MALRRLRVHPQEEYLRRQREPLPTGVEQLPDLSSAFGRVLDAGLRELSLELRPDQRRAVEDHVRLLLAWNAAINLTAIRDSAEIARLHVVDSLAAVHVLRAEDVERFVDLGSGGGFPGIPLAVALDVEALLVESVAKKARFLDAVSDALGRPRLRAEATRAEALATGPADRERWPAVTARAVAALADLVELAFPLLRRGGILVAWKRGHFDDELASAQRAAAAMGGGTVSVASTTLTELPGHRLVVVRKTGATGPEWPRDPAARRRRPW